jgi:hypothetical protein
MRERAQYRKFYSGLSGLAADGTLEESDVKVGEMASIGINRANTWGKPDP